ncbi:hypothetical protein [Hymenobacter persicinus]|uniref:Uncharacterized protein n=1 Tax=Hymenobacter persicinus TaxID=2025506 RepID=A0A4Q5LFD1_9BACT|nr:hypothetical protein [Hymenobacter persicinus]RYU83781.1 hypothetical protein EWM57_02215 [Hymenobacter persicinus]
MLKFSFSGLYRIIGLNFVLTRAAHYFVSAMKSSLRFVLLFALIVVGRLAKEPVASAAAAKVVHPETPVQNASFFARQTSPEPVSAGSGSRLWQATAPTTRTTVSVE